MSFLQFLSKKEKKSAIFFYFWSAKPYPDPEPDHYPDLDSINLDTQHWF